MYSASYFIYLFYFAALLRAPAEKSCLHDLPTLPTAELSVWDDCRKQRIKNPSGDNPGSGLVHAWTSTPVLPLQKKPGIANRTYTLGENETCSDFGTPTPLDISTPLAHTEFHWPTPSEIASSSYVASPIDVATPVCGDESQYSIPRPMDIDTPQQSRDGSHTPLQSRDGSSMLPPDLPFTPITLPRLKKLRLEPVCYDFESSSSSDVSEISLPDLNAPQVDYQSQSSTNSSYQQISHSRPTSSNSQQSSGDSDESELQSSLPQLQDDCSLSGSDPKNFWDYNNCELSSVQDIFADSAWASHNPAEFDSVQDIFANSAWAGHAHCTCLLTSCLGSTVGAEQTYASVLDDAMCMSSNNGSSIPCHPQLSILDDAMTATPSSSSDCSMPLSPSPPTLTPQKLTLSPHSTIAGSPPNLSPAPLIQAYANSLGPEEVEMTLQHWDNVQTVTCYNALGRVTRKISYF